MVRNRRGLAPWSLAREAGVESATVDGTIDVPQTVQPVLDTGFVDENGNWKGTKSDDKEFIALQTDEAIANSGTFLTPGINPDGTWPLDMTGYNNLFIAIKPTNGGNYAISAVMGPDSNRFANLSPVNPNSTLIECTVSDGSDFTDGFVDGSQGMTADVWNIFLIKDRLCCWKLLQFRMVNNSGGISTIETAYMRMV